MDEIKKAAARMGLLILESRETGGDLPLLGQIHDYVIMKSRVSPKFIIRVLDPRKKSVDCYTGETDEEVIDILEQLEK